MKFSKKEIKEHVQRAKALSLMIFFACVVVTEHKRTIKVVNLIEELCKLDPFTFTKFDAGKPITPTQLDIVLESYDIKSEPICFEDGIENGYYCSDFTKIAEQFTKTPLPKRV